MSDKQIFASVEVADHEVRLVVGEFFNARFNIIKVERIPCFGITYDQVLDPDEISNALRKASSSAKRTIGAEIKKVILAIPSYKTKKYSLRSTVDVSGIDGVITIQDVRNAIKKAESVNISKDYALIQTVCVKYIVNGIATRRIPIGEKCSQLSIDVDLLCADRKLAYDLVGCVENAGLQVLDIFPEVYAVGKEAALFERAVEKQIVVLKIERQSTVLGLFRKGRLTTAGVLPAGLGNLVSDCVDQYGVATADAVELLKYSIRFNQKVYTDNPVHIWSKDGETKTISEKQFVESIQKNVAQWVKDLIKTCEPILQAGPTTVIITGEGGETEGLSDLLSESLGCSVKCYIPETLGGRNAGLTAPLGLLYAYQDKLPITGYIDDSLDMDAFKKSVSYREKKKEIDSKEDTLTSKLKGLFFENKAK